MRARSLLPALLTTAALTLTGCGTDGGPTAGGGDGRDSAGRSAAPSSGDSADEGPADGDSAEGNSGAGEGEAPEVLRFTGTTVDGKTFKGASLAGRPTVLWFWAPWCPKCRAQASETARVAAEYEGEAHVVGVAGLDKNAAMKDFVKSQDVGAFSHIDDEVGDVWKKFGVSQQSTYVVLDKDGETAFTGNLPAGKGLAGKVGELVG